MDPHAAPHLKLLAADLLILTVHPSSSRSPALTRACSLPVARAETVGVVVSRDRAAKFLRFLVDDGTGVIPCILWMNHHLLSQASRRHDGPVALDVAAEAAEEFAETVRLGALVRVRGRVGFYRGSVQITVAGVVAERDANVEVLHWLECIKLGRLCYDARKQGS